ncbi:unnamed protein product [Ilex paraguariensis]|uniref:Expansin-like EG45 domain-containing protein n=1 Tax=Ilex paraguariensis TaxID=185542 RepID=A0ABC8UTV2_9AQUA
MGVQTRVLMMVGIVICLASGVSAIQGSATYYDPPYYPSACFPNQQNGDSNVAGASNVLWNNRAACGRRYRVRCTGANNLFPRPCTGATVDVKIVDYCSKCNGTINLSRDAFSKIADLKAGNIRIEYNQI